MVSEVLQDSILSTLDLKPPSPITGPRGLDWVIPHFGGLFPLSYTSSHTSYYLSGFFFLLSVGSGTGMELSSGDPVLWALHPGSPGPGHCLPQHVSQVRSAPPIPFEHLTPSFRHHLICILPLSTAWSPSCTACTRSSREIFASHHPVTSGSLPTWICCIMWWRLECACPSNYTRCALPSLPLLPVLGKVWRG